jgi:hypothetical protein
MGAPEQADGGVQAWSKPQHAIAYREARAVLNAQQQRNVNLDDKALRTTRLVTVVVGALITAVEAFGLAIAGPVGYVGIGLLVVAFVASLAAYTVEGPSLGPNTAELRELVRTNDEEWQEQFLLQLSASIDENAARLDRSSILLLASDVALTIGVIAVLSAIGL